ncbi:L-threonine 3-dehydrogenase, partial [Hyalella azteca]|uniref:L-threonine 3-dehydrogenase n=1 Tax=Hyalella azteca TaxID=294128 RepID=A0A8B7NJ68_HYAAZ
MSTGKTMRCLLKTNAEEGYDMAERSVPVPGPHDVVIRVDKVGICGSDISLYKWNDVAKAIASLPFIPGHEATGVVVEVGTEVDSSLLGKRVAVENHFYCGDCALCKEDRGDICLRMDQYGHGRGTGHGGCSQFSLEDRGDICLRMDQYGHGRGTGVAHNAVSHCEVRGKQALVLGCGAVGLFAVAVCKALGATQIMAVDVVASKLEIAKKMGASHVVNASKTMRCLLKTNGEEGYDMAERSVPVPGPHDVVIRVDKRRLNNVWPVRTGLLDTTSHHTWRSGRLSCPGHRRPPLRRSTGPNILRHICRWYNWVWNSLQKLSIANQ